VSPPAAPRLRNIGPKSAAWLRQVGLRTLDDLAAVGPVEAYMRVRRAGFRPGLNLLYAIEGALNDTHWQEVPDARRTELVAAFEAGMIPKTTPISAENAAAPNIASTGTFAGGKFGISDAASTPTP
jgi:hypothetical protein